MNLQSLERTIRDNPMREKSPGQLPNSNSRPRDTKQMPDT